MVLGEGKLKVGKKGSGEDKERDSDNGERVPTIGKEVIRIHGMVVGPAWMTIYYSKTYITYLRIILIYYIFDFYSNKNG